MSSADFLKRTEVDCRIKRLELRDGLARSGLGGGHSSRKRFVAAVAAVVFLSLVVVLVAATQLELIIFVVAVSAQVVISFLGLVVDLNYLCVLSLLQSCSLDVGWFS